MTTFRFLIVLNRKDGLLFVLKVILLPNAWWSSGRAFTYHPKDCGFEFCENLLARPSSKGANLPPLAPMSSTLDETAVNFITSPSELKRQHGKVYKPTLLNFLKFFTSCPFHVTVRPVAAGSLPVVRTLSFLAGTRLSNEHISTRVTLDGRSSLLI